MIHTNKAIVFINCEYCGQFYGFLMDTHLSVEQQKVNFNYCNLCRLSSYELQ